MLIHYESIERGDFPRWTMRIQLMTEKEAGKCPFNPFDLTVAVALRIPMSEVQKD